MSAPPTADASFARFAGPGVRRADGGLLAGAVLRSRWHACRGRSCGLARARRRSSRERTARDWASRRIACLRGSVPRSSRMRSKSARKFASSSSRARADNARRVQAERARPLAGGSVRSRAARARAARRHAGLRRRVPLLRGSRPVLFLSPRRNDRAHGDAGLDEISNARCSPGSSCSPCSAALSARSRRRCSWSRRSRCARACCRIWSALRPARCSAPRCSACCRTRSSRSGISGTHNIGLTLLAGLLVFFVLEKMVLWRHCHQEVCEGHVPPRARHRHSSATPRPRRSS